MPSSSSSRSSKPRPAEVAAETKRFIKNSAGAFNGYAYLFAQPLAMSYTEFPHRPTMNLNPPIFWVREGDPVDFATCWSAENNDTKVAFICAANENRPGGDWETGVVGYEERLCRRSNLSQHLATPKEVNYPIPPEGGLFSDPVVVFRGPHDRYEHRDSSQWRGLPVVSVVPTRWPKLQHNGTRYSFESERDLAKRKLRAALTICVYNDIRSVVIGDFGLGSCRNPPHEMAEMWREVFLWDPNLRGQLENVAFVFDDRSQSTARLIAEDAAKKGGRSGGSGSGSSSSKSKSKSKGTAKASSSSSSYSSGHADGHPTDYDIFAYVFSSAEINRVLTERDTRMGVQNLMS
ncbi:hypothetical protein M406DRAFT_261961 [Cryphonectria parasitica EP155]|uniref:Microbial-type PARG catalytic domain-containing protein n=1 Tax=Cryphonectria parasitica (strain ATCC 38755 / EP155) TaxID=660469 RepID=A0A9P4XYG4_CRYP1|nr:uncharacterized protein M406DRAFT_261961 [Cryphonectria parasitica EP155]KAF3763092.1 hypothetical protein M406DRAFT_261961 [Cryphonectria parasitica EP155]